MKGKPQLSIAEFETVPAIAEAMRLGVLGELVLTNFPDVRQDSFQLPSTLHGQLSVNEQAIILAAARGITNASVPQVPLLKPYEQSRITARRAVELEHRMHAANRAHLIRRAVELDLIPGLVRPLTPPSHRLYSPRHIFVVGLQSHGFTIEKIAKMMGTSTRPIYSATRDVAPDYSGRLLSAVAVTESFRLGLLQPDNYLAPDFVGVGVRHLLSLGRQLVVPPPLFPYEPQEWPPHYRPT